MNNVDMRLDSVADRQSGRFMDERQTQWTNAFNQFSSEVDSVKRNFIWEM